MEDDVTIEDINVLKKEFKKRLVKADKLLLKMKQQKRFARIKGANLLERMLREAKHLEITDQINFYKISNTKNKKAIYVARRGGRVDISGFDLSHPLVVPMSREEAKRRKLGRVCGQLNFKDNSATDKDIMEVFKKALEILSV